MKFLKSIWNRLFAVDKLLHALSGLCIFLLWDKHINIPYELETGIALIPVLVAGAAKEIYDEYIKKTEQGGDPWDFFATVFPPLIIFITFY